MAGNEDLESKINEKPVETHYVKDSLKAIPSIACCTLVASALNFPGCGGSKAIGFLQYNLAAGSGLYGGAASKRAGRFVSLITLGASMIPEAVLLANNEDKLEYIGLSAGFKCLSYCFAYGIGMLFRRKN